MILCHRTRNEPGTRVAGRMALQADDFSACGRDEGVCPIANPTELAVERQREGSKAAKNADRQLIGQGTTRLASLS